MVSKNLIVSFAFVLLLVACAKIGSLSGGKKDIIPPKLISSVPQQFAKNFNGKKIRLDFDEFIKLNDVNKQLVISPPLQKQPEIVQLNKSIYITFNSKEQLIPNKTYSFYFGNSVQDLNEGNIYKNFEFVFSTGPVIDSLSVKGIITKAFDLKPDKDGFYILLYDRFEDSIPRKQLPNYITKSDERGWFTLTHLHAGNYMVFGLKDQNQNYKFDIGNEQIAFKDSLLKLNSSFFIPQDSLRIDTTKMDSAKKAKFVFRPDIELFSFEEDYKNQKLIKYERNLNRFTLFFDRHEHDTITIKPLNFISNDWKISDRKTFSDTLNYWITDSSLVRKDSLKIAVRYFKHDSAGNIVPQIDTVALVTKLKPGGKSKKNKEKKPVLLKFESGLSGNTVDLNSSMFFMASSPIKTIDTDSIHLFKVEEDKEKSTKELKYKLVKDSLVLRRFRLDFAMEPNTSYKFIADSGSIHSIYGETIDSTGIEFKSQKDDYYGNIKLTLSNVTEPLILQLVTDKDGVIKEKYTDKNGVVLFDFVSPGKYKIKAIFDRNRNKTWDTGNFKKRLQPEQVKYYNKTLDVRSNWDMESSWEL